MISDGYDTYYQIPWKSLNNFMALHKKNYSNVLWYIERKVMILITISTNRYCISFSQNHEKIVQHCETQYQLLLEKLASYSAFTFLDFACLLWTIFLTQNRFSQLLICIFLKSEWLKEICSSIQTDYDFALQINGPVSAW